MATHHRGMTLSHAHAVQRVSSDSSLSSTDEAENSAASGQGQPVAVSHRRGSNSKPSGGGGHGEGKAAQSSTVATLKKLSQLPTSSSEDSLDEGGGGGGGGGGSKPSSSPRQDAGGQVPSPQPRHHQYPQYGASQVDTTSMSSSAISGCSTFPRRHHRNNNSNSNSSSSSNTNSSNTGTLKNGKSGNSNKSASSPPLPPREAIAARTAWKPASAKVPGLDFPRQVSCPGPNTGIAGGQAGRNFQNRARLTTNKAGYVQQRASPRQASATADSAPNPTGSLSRTYKNSSGSGGGSGSGSKSSGKSPTSQRRMLTSSIVSSLSSSVDPSAANSTAPPGWQLAQRVKRGSNSSATESSSSGNNNNNSSSSNSEASSPQSLMRSSSAQQTTTSGSMQESSSAHSLGHSWGSLGPDDTPTTNTASPFPPHSDSSGSLSSLPRNHQQAKGRQHVPHSESSGSLTGRSGVIGHVEGDRGSIHSASSNTNVNSKNSNEQQQQQQQNHTNNNLDGTSMSSTQLDNEPGISGSQSRLPTVTDGSVGSSSSIPQPPSFLNSKYAVVHPNTAHASPSSPSLNAGGMPISSSSSSSSKPHSLELEILKRASTDSILSSVSAGGQAASPTGSGLGIPREDSSQSICSSTGSTGSGGNRRLSPQSTVHMGISSVQRKLQEQERTKLEVNLNIV